MGATSIASNTPATSTTSTTSTTATTASIQELELKKLLKNQSLRDQKDAKRRKLVIEIDHASNLIDFNLLEEVKKRNKNLTHIYAVVTVGGKGHDGEENNTKKRRRRRKKKKKNSRNQDVIAH